jgi:REP element-mobilizing transposase RayT
VAGYQSDQECVRRFFIRQNFILMTYNLVRHNRKSIRLKGYDYSQPGEYFITICTHDKKCVFGKVIEEKIILSPIGEIAKKCWEEIPEHYPKVELDEYIIMPNHIHGIIIMSEGRDLINQILTTENNFPLMKNPKETLGKIIRYYKARSTKLIHNSGYIDFQWQSLFYDRIVRSDNELNNIRDYITNNPLKWYLDEENPNNICD